MSNATKEKRLKTYVRDAMRPPRLNFFPLRTRAGTIGTDDCKGTVGIGELVVAKRKISVEYLTKTKFNKTNLYKCDRLS